MKMRTIVTHILILLTCTACGRINRSSATEQPDFLRKEWTAINVKYWLCTATKPLERSFTVTNAATIEEMKGRWRIAKVTRLSIGVDDQFVLVESDGTQWQGNVVFENAINLCKTQDKRHSYRLDLKDTAVFDSLMNLCLLNERQFHAKAVADNIILRRNLSKEHQPIEE